MGVELRERADLLNPLSLAFLGDTVFDLAVRTLLLDKYNTKPHSLHVMASARVKASAQAKASEAILPILSEDETAIFRRARNSKPGMLPKNANPEDYAAATGLEALCGWLFLSGQEERLLELLKIAIDSQGDEDAKIKRAFRPKR